MCCCKHVLALDQRLHETIIDCMCSYCVCSDIYLLITMYMLVCLVCVWLSLVSSRLATASFSGSGDNLLSPSSNEIGEEQ